MAEKGLTAPTPKLKTKFPVASQTTKRGNNSLNPRVVIRPIDYNQGQNAVNPPNQLPTPLIPAYLPNQQNIPNQQNQPDQPQNIPNPPPPPPIPANLPN